MSSEEAALIQQTMEMIRNSAPALAALIITHIIEFILLKKKIIFYGLEKKIEKAKKLGQVVTAELASSKHELVRDGYSAARYVYSIDGIHKKTKVISAATSERWTTWPDKINIYYLKHRVYTDYDSQPSNFFFVFLPWIIACIVMALTHPELLS